MQDALKTILLLDAHGQFSPVHDRSHLVMGNANVLDDYAESVIFPSRPGVMATGCSDILDVMPEANHPRGDPVMPNSPSAVSQGLRPLGGDQ